MYKCACGLTSVAMVLAFNEIHTGLDGRPVDPMSINEYFSRNAVQLTSKTGKVYYNSWGYGWGDFNFFKVDDYANETNKVVGSQPKLDQPVREPYSLDRLKAYLNNDVPVILKTVPSGGGTHFVVAKGYSGDNVIVNDPFFPDPVSGYTTLSQRGYAPSMSENAMTHYVQTHSDFSSFDIYSDGDSLITDNQGRRLGKDQSLTTIYKEIPKSYYEVHEPINDPEGPSSPSEGEGMIFASIQTPGSGKYTVIPRGESGDRFNLDITITNISGDPKRFIISGTINGVVPTYTFSYTDQGGGTLDPTLVIIDVLPGIKPNYLLANTWIPIPVAILSDTAINPTTDINLKTVTFG